MRRSPRSAARRMLAAPALLALAVPSGLLAAEEAGHARFTFGTLGGKRQVAMGPRHLYYLSAEKELCVLARPAPGTPPPAATPGPLGKLKLEGVPEALEWIDERTLAVGTGNHLAVVEVEEPSSPRLLAELAVARREIEGVSEVRRKGNALYLAARKQGLLRVDVSDRARPRLAGSLAVGGFAGGLDLEGDLAAVATGAGLALVRLLGESMTLEGTADTLRNAEVVRLSGRRLFFASKEYLCLYDVADPRHPVELGEVSNRDPFFHSHNVALHLDGDLVYAAATEGGLYLWDWKDPGSPRLLVQFSFWGNERPITREAKVKYLESLGLASPPEAVERSISTVENVHLPAVGMAVDGPLVYLADYKGRVWALEVKTGPEPSARCVMRPE